MGMGEGNLPFGGFSVGVFIVVVGFPDPFDYHVEWGYGDSWVDCRIRRELPHGGGGGGKI